MVEMLCYPDGSHCFGAALHLHCPDYPNWSQGPHSRVPVLCLENGPKALHMGQVAKKRSDFRARVFLVLFVFPWIMNVVQIIVCMC